MTTPPTTVWLILLAFMPVACGGGDDPVSPTAPSREVSISIAGPTSLVVGASSQFTATAMLSDRSTEDVTNSATWTSSNTTVATVAAAGSVTARQMGVATIRATHAGLISEVSLTVSAPSRPVDSRFNDTFWRQFVYNQFARPNTISGRVSYVLETTSPNVYIRTGDPTGRRVVSNGLRDHILRAIPRLAEQLTGQPYRGVTQYGIDDRMQRGWITVRFVTYEEEPEISEGACGRATVGADQGSIWIIRRARGNKSCVSDRAFPELFAHEFGHALGFWHVPGTTGLGNGWGGMEWNSRLQFA